MTSKKMTRQKWKFKKWKTQQAIEDEFHDNNCSKQPHLAHL